MFYRSIGRSGIEKGRFFVDRAGTRFYLDDVMAYVWIGGSLKAAKADHYSHILVKEGIAVSDRTEADLARRLQHLVV